MFIKGHGAGQSIHNIVVVEEGAELHILGGCATAHEARDAAHLGITEYYVEKGGKLTFTMVRDEKTTWRKKDGGPDFPSPFGSDTGWFRQQMLEALKKVVVSPKKEHGKAGELHEDTKCRILQQDTRNGSDKMLIRYRRAMDKLKDKKSVAGILPGATIPNDLPAVQTAHASSFSILGRLAGTSG